MTVLTIINNLRKICASLSITDNLQENHAAWRQNDREKSRNNTDGQQNHRNNDRDDRSDMWSCPLHLIITIEHSGIDCCAVCNCPLRLIIYIGDGEGNIEDSEEEQRKARRNSNDHWEMVQRWRRNTEERSQEREPRRRSTEERSQKKEWRANAATPYIKS